LVDIIISSTGTIPSDMRPLIDPIIDNDDALFFKIPENTKIFHYTKPRTLEDSVLEVEVDEVDPDQKAKLLSQNLIKKITLK